MSKIYVDEIAGIASADTVAIPGHVIQVVNVKYSDYATTTSTTLSTISGLEASITPVSTSSSILILINANGVSNNTAGSFVRFELGKNNSSISYLSDVSAYIPSGGANIASQPISWSYLDTPSTTDTITYSLMWRSWSGGTVFINNYATGDNRTLSTITLMEIAG